MLICLWKGCDFVCKEAEAAAFQEHILKHGQQQQQLMNLDNQQKNETSTEKDVEDEEPMAKRAKMEEDEQSAMNEGEGIGNRKIPLISEDVWYDVLAFITRIQLARSVSLSSRLIHDICWPRLHGFRVTAYEIIGDITFEYREHFDWSRPATEPLVKKDGKEVPFPCCLPPAYITGFRRIIINYLDNQVLKFLQLIAPCIAKNPIFIIFRTEYIHYNEWQCARVNRLVKMFKEDFPQIKLHVKFPLGMAKSLRDMDLLRSIHWATIRKVSEIPLLIQLLASPRPDGQQWAMILQFRSPLFAQNALDAIKEEFHAATQSVPQPFFLCFYRVNLNIPRTEEQNLSTNETLTITPPQNGHLDICLEICRHPNGQHEKWAKDGLERLCCKAGQNGKTAIVVDLKNLMEIEEFFWKMKNWHILFKEPFYIGI